MIKINNYINYTCGRIEYNLFPMAVLWPYYYVLISNRVAVLINWVAGLTPELPKMGIGKHV